ncbi:MAG: hypothetical protein KME15_23720 [Drouetiella hepatica Uher 2000/2452]|uniref:Uncharacterized protein n=1 Tax=Drouetiella hepatica Uher 2000/2452 TaxID=904376 RepID=A0A951QFE9_9CYAN|nr:hypothetical protein [Drouetiella hepatica Uher 2000/2452]
MQALLDRDEPVTVVSHTPSKADRLKQRGAHSQWRTCLMWRHYVAYSVRTIGCFCSSRRREFTPARLNLKVFLEKD